MIDHILIRVQDLEKSKQFYQKAFEPLGYKLAFGEEKVFWAFELHEGCLFEIAQYTGDTKITSTHIGFRLETRKKVDEFYENAMSAGAINNGKPGTRPHYTDNYYACFFLDPDGHNIEGMHDE